MYQRVDQQCDQRLAKSYPPRQYLDIALEAGKYKIHCPAKAFDSPMLSVSLSIRMYIHTIITCMRTHFISFHVYIFTHALCIHTYCLYIYIH